MNMIFLSHKTTDTAVISFVERAARVALDQGAYIDI